jgi:diguanylate cyclase (GGDEF)-like protein
MTENLRAAVETGEARTTLDATRDAASTTEVYSAFGMRSWMHQPAARHGSTAVVLTVGWSEPRRRAVPARAREALPLLAAEAAAAIDRAELVDRLAELARHDPLTGLMNRRAWDDHVAREVARMRRTGRPLSVAVIDLDHFKAFNDQYGHLVGDQLLKSAAGAWVGALRSSDVLARWGGEEFAVLMPDAPAEEALRILGRLAERTPMGQTFSGGFVTTTEAVAAEQLMAGADVAVYSAKAAGRNRIHRGEVALGTAALEAG